jgi:tetratricopeptide (TPR) repeat protein
MSAPISSDYRYWAFISYTSADEKWARWLHRSIEDYRLPKSFVGKHTSPTGELVPQRFRPIILDRDELPAAADLKEEVRGALRHSRSLIVVCSPRAAQSTWVDTEVRTFRDLGRGERILAIIIDGDPNAVDGDQCFPPALRDGLPLAADLRPRRMGGDGRTNAKLKLLAAMLGVSFDALKQRDAHRKIRRLQFMLAGVSLLLLSFATLAWYANQQRLAATRSRQQALEHLEYLMFDLKERLEPMGKLDLLEELVKKTQTFADQSTDSKDIQYLRSVAYLNQGDLALAKGNTHQALTSVESSVNLRKNLLGIEADSPKRQSAYAEALSYLGRVQAARGDFGKAVQNQLQSVQIFESSAVADSLEFLQKSSSANAAAAETMRLLGRTQEARTLQFRCVDLLRLANRLDPEDLSFRRELAASLDRLGDLLVRINADDALADYKEALTIRQDLIALHPESLPLQEDLSRSRESFAAWYVIRGDTQVAMDYYQKAIAIRESLVSQERQNARWQHLLAQSRANIADNFIVMDRLAEAQTNCFSCLAIYTELERRDPENTMWQEGTVAALEKLGDILKARCATSGGDKQAGMDRVLSYYQSARAKREQLFQLDSQNLNWLRGLSISDIRLGDWNYELRDWDKALDFYRSSAEKRATLAAADSSNLDWAYMLGVAYGKIGLAYRGKHDWPSAQTYAWKQLEAAEQTTKSNPDNALWVGDCALANYRLGTLYGESAQSGVGSTAEAKQHLLRARELFTTLKSRGFLSPVNDRYLSSIDAMLGKLK